MTMQEDLKSTHVQDRSLDDGQLPQTLRAERVGARQQARLPSRDRTAVALHADHASQRGVVFADGTWVTHGNCGP